MCSMYKKLFSSTYWRVTVSKISTPPNDHKYMWKAVCENIEMTACYSKEGKRFNTEAEALLDFSSIAKVQCICWERVK